jgi:hypothetical protein
VTKAAVELGNLERATAACFLTNRLFREQHGNAAPVVIWLNLASNREVDELHRLERTRRAHRLAAGIEALETARIHRSGPRRQPDRAFHDFRADQ